MKASRKEAFMNNHKIFKPAKPVDSNFIYCKKYDFYYIKKKNCKNIDNISILGEVDLKNKNIENSSDDILELTLKNGYIKRCNIKPLNKEIKNSSLLIHIDDNKYIAINTRESIALIKLSGIMLPLILFISINSFIFAIYKTDINNIILKNITEHILSTQQKPIVENADIWNGELHSNKNNSETSQSTSNISIPGYSQLYIDSKNTSINLINPTVNDIYFKYIVEINGSIIYSSNMIEPGKSLKVNMYEKLKKGNYLADFKIETYDIKTNEQYNGATQKVNIEVK